MKPEHRELLRLARPWLLEPKQVRRAFTKINSVCQVEGFTPIPKEGFDSFAEVIAMASEDYWTDLVHWKFKKMSRDKEAPLYWRKIEKKGVMFAGWLVAFDKIDAELKAELASLLEFIGGPTDLIVTLGKDLKSLVAACEAFMEIAEPAQGKTGENVTKPGGPPITPLYRMNRTFGNWWNNHVEGRRWRPSFHSEKRVEVTPTNTEAVIFVVVSQLFDTRYSASNCLAVVETRVGRGKMPKKKRLTIMQIAEMRSSKKRRLKNKK